jgi:uncharacterized protein YecE (DUF72 family)
MNFAVGTSGYSYKEWKGNFYPDKLPHSQMLSFYAQRFHAVEVNNTFYRMPRRSVMESWAHETPEGFQFVLKASQRLTHFARLKDVEDPLEYLLDVSSALEARRGPLLFQLPSNFRKDIGRLTDFLNLLGGRARAAFEFRHESWFDDEVFDALRTHSCALCIADMEDTPFSDLIDTAGWGYLRMRRESYTDRELTAWIERLLAQPWESAYVFFKHEEAGVGPKLAKRFLELTAT